MLERVRERVWTGIAGLVAAVVVGTGEFLLHYDPLTRYAEDGTYLYMTASTEARLTAGHFLVTMGLPLYFAGLWHIYLMLRPASRRLAFGTFLLAFQGFFFAGVWITSRASIGSLVHHPEVIAGTDLVSLYQVRYEILIQGVRAMVVVLSLAIAGLALTGRSRYPRWMAAFNPAVLLGVNFVPVRPRARGRQVQRHHLAERRIRDLLCPVARLREA